MKKTSGSQKRGRSLEKLIEHLENVLSGQSHSNIESPGYLCDTLTGTQREHDVLLTIQQGHHEIIVAFECRDRKRKITVNQIDSFARKCHDTRVNKGVIVSSTGFSKTATEKAEKLGIRCLTLDSIDSFDWLLAPGIWQVIRNVIHVESTVIPQSPIEKDPSAFKLVASDGTVVTPETLKENAIRRMNEMPIDQRSGRFRIRIPFKAGDLRISLEDGGEEHAIRSIICDVDYEVSITLAEFKLMQYSDLVSGNAITDVAVAEIDTDPTKGRLVITSKQGFGANVAYIPHTPSAASSSDS